MLLETQANRQKVANCQSDDDAGDQRNYGSEVRVDRPLEIIKRLLLVCFLLPTVALGIRDVIEDWEGHALGCVAVTERQSLHRDDRV